MTWRVWRHLEEWLTGLHETGGYRGLVVLHASSIRIAAEQLAARLSTRLGRGLCVAPAEYRGSREIRKHCSRILSPSALEEILGTEAGFALLLVPHLLRPNLVAAAGEAVRRGGVLALAVPRLEEWRPGGDYGIGAYKAYLVNRLYAARSIFWASLDEGIVYVSRLPRCCAPSPEPAHNYNPRAPLPRRLLEAAASREQAEALDRIVLFFRRRGRAVFVIGDRGRGKSGLLGLTAAYLIHSHMAGFIAVTGPSVWSVQSMFRVLAEALEALGVRHWIVRRHGVAVGIAGPWFHVRYHTADKLTPGAYTFIDEAAAVGPTRLRAIASRSPRLLAATTIHGYEGSGRVLASLAEKVLPEPHMRIELHTPVRYPPRDPLEEWLYDTFMLRVEEPPAPAVAEPADTLPIEVDRRRLAEDYEQLRNIYSILVTAHYRNEPDDLALILDALHHRLYALFYGGHVVAAADVAEEGPETPWEHRILFDKLAESAGIYRGLKGWRIVRIAVHPRLQGRGLGSRLVGHIEDRAHAAGAEWLGAIYGRPTVTKFWLRNGFLPTYVSPLPSRATGEHNVGVAKGLTAAGNTLIIAAALDLQARLLWGLPSLYRSLDPEAAALLLEGSPILAASTTEEKGPTRSQVSRLRRVAAGQSEPEAALDAIAAGLHLVAARYGGLWPLEWRERLVAVSRVLQGRTPRELHHLIEATQLRAVLQRLAAEILVNL